MRAIAAVVVTALAVLAGACASRPAPPRDGTSPRERLEEPAAKRTAEPPRPPDAPCVVPQRPDAVAFDRGTQAVEDTLCNAARWLDGLFGDGQSSNGRATQGQVEVSAFHSEFYGTDVRLRLNARVRLPALEKRLSAFVGRENDEDYARDRAEGFGLRSMFALDEPVDWFTGLAYGTSIADNVSADTRVGVRGVSDPQLFVQERVNIRLYADDVNLVQWRATPFWNSDDRFGLTNSLDLSHVLAPSLLIRWGNAATVSQETRGLDWRSAVILYQSLAGQRALGYQVFVRGQTDEPEPLREYGAFLLYRQPVARQRVWVLLQGGYSWPRTDPELPRHGAVGLGLGLQVPLGGR